MTHRLCSRIVDDQPQGYAALNWESILHGNAGELGDYKELAVLPDKIARYLYEYHADSYASHDLPVLPADRSRTNVHGILKPHQVELPRCLFVIKLLRHYSLLMLFSSLTE